MACNLLQLVRVVLWASWRHIWPVILTRGRDDHAENWIHNVFYEEVE